MKLVRYGAPEPLWGALDGEHVTPLGPTAQASEQAALQWLADGHCSMPQDAPALPLHALALLPPLARAATVYGIGLNYRAHVAETGHGLPTQPTLFVRNAASLVGAGAALLRPRASAQYDYEGELAVVIGRGGRHIAQHAALSHVGALTCFNDGSLRDYQQHSLAAGKNFHRSGACGPWLVRPQDAGDMNALCVLTRLNGQVVQRASTSQLIHTIAQLIAYLSAIVELRTGDLIATGTPQGVGARRDPPLWLRPQDRVEVEVQGVGCLANPVEDDGAG